MRFEEPYYVTGHAVDQYQNRIEDVSKQEVVRRVNVGLQGRAPYPFGVQRTHRTMEVSDHNHTFVAVIAPPPKDDRSWPRVVTVVPYEERKT